MTNNNTTILLKDLSPSLRETIAGYMGLDYSRVAAQFDIEDRRIRANSSFSATPMDCARTLVGMICSPGNNWTIADLCLAFENSGNRNNSNKTQKLMATSYKHPSSSDGSSSSALQTEKSEIDALKRELALERQKYQILEEVKNQLQEVISLQEEMIRERDALIVELRGAIPTPPTGNPVLDPQKFPVQQSTPNVDPVSQKITLPMPARDATMILLTPSNRGAIARQIAPIFEDIATVMSNPNDLHGYAVQARTNLYPGAPVAEQARWLVDTLYNRNTNLPLFIEKIAEINPQIASNICNLINKN